MNNVLTPELFGLFGILGGLWVAAQDFFGSDIFTITRATVFRFEQTSEEIAKHLAG